MAMPTNPLRWQPMNPFMRSKRMNGVCTMRASITLVVPLVLVYAYLMVSFHSTVSSTDHQPVHAHLEDFKKVDPAINLRNATFQPFDPNEMFPVVMAPYKGSVDPYYNIPSDGTNLWDNNLNIPPWMKAYFNWHKWRRQTWNSSNWQNERWLIMQCLADQDGRKCGGTADRLKPLPVLVRIAYEHRRMLLIRWTRPAMLEEYLVPPAHGVDWRVPEWMANVMSNPDNGKRLVPSKMILKYAPTNLTILRSRYQSYDGGSGIYNAALEEGDLPFNEVFSHVWNLFFRPSAPIEAILKEELQRMGLVPGHYVSAHLRALYAIQDRDVGQTQTWAQNAVNCASNLRPGAPIFFASDSVDALSLAKNYSLQIGARLESHSPNPNPPLHLDRDREWQSRQVSDFYDTFVDLYLIALGGCVTYNKGGYGHWGLLIGGDSHCFINQDTAQSGHIRKICKWMSKSSGAAAPPEQLNKPLFLDAMD